MQRATLFAIFGPLLVLFFIVPAYAQTTPEPPLPTYSMEITVTATPPTERPLLDCADPVNAAKDILCSPINLLVSSDDPNRTTYLERIKAEGIQAILLSLASLFAGGAASFAVVALIYGAFLYVTSHGNEEQITKAKQFIVYTLIGLVLLSLTYVIVIALRDLIYGQSETLFQ